MCGFIGMAGDHSVEIPKGAWNSISWRGEIAGGYSSDDVRILASRLPRSGARMRRQPIVIPEILVLAFNGEVYNCDELNGGSYPDSTLSDAEMLAIALARATYMPALLSRLRGEFALAIFDFRSQSLFLARDSFGSKPLFFRSRGRNVVFGSTARSVAFIAGNSPQIDVHKLRDELEFGLTDTQNIFTEVNSIPSGTCLEFYIGANRDPVVHRLSHAQSSHSDAMVIKRAVMDRNPGLHTAIAFSGGVDSSVIACLAPSAQRFSLGPIHLDLSDVPTITVTPSPLELVSALRHLWRFTDRPLPTLSAAGMHLLSKRMVSAGIEICLGGEGGDEIFGGYSHRASKGRGHPVLVRHSYQYRIAVKLLRLDELPIAQSEISEVFSKSDNIKDWDRFDRWWRLPKHLAPTHTDLPGLSCGVEFRLPYLDLTPTKMPDREKTQKEPLRQLLRAEGWGPKPPIKKQGLVVSYGSIGDSDAVDLVRELLDEKMPCISSDLASQLEFGLKAVAIFPEDVRAQCRTTVKRMALQLASVTQLVRDPGETICRSEAYSIIPLATNGHLGPPIDSADYVEA